MYDLSDESRTIWKELKQGSLGTVLWAFRTDERVVVSFSDALSRLHTPEGLVESLEYPVTVAANCVGQIAFHQLAAEESSPPHVEPRDSRWSPLRPLGPEVPVLIARSI